MKKETKGVVIRKAKDKKEIMSFDNNQELQLLKDTYAKGATDTEFKMLFAVGNRVGADPFKREIYLIPFWDTNEKRLAKAPVVSIDWYRKQAGKSKNYGGQGETEFGPIENTNGVEHPAWAITPIYNKQFSQPVRVKIFWKEVVKTDKQGQAVASWKNMPHIMLAKTSEAQGIRKAFPEEVGGVYTEDEMKMPIEAEYEIVKEKTNADLLKETTKEYINREEKLNFITDLIKEKSKDLDRMLDFFKVKELSDLTDEQIETAITLLKNMPDTPKGQAKVIKTPKEKPQKAEIEEIEPPVEEMPAPTPKKAVKAKKDVTDKKLSNIDPEVEEAVNEFSAHDPKDLTPDQKEFLSDVVADTLKSKIAYPNVFK